MTRKLFLILALALFCVVGARATVTSQNTSATFTCTGSTGPYSFTFPISDPTALTVIQAGATLAPTAYTIAPVNNNYANGGNVTLNTACSSGTLVLQRATPLTQASVFTDNMPVPMKTFERGLDKLTEISQEFWNEFGPLVTSQIANEFYASPNGSSGVPGFRAIVSADLPATITSNTTGNAATATTATALASTPSQCSGTQFAQGIAASGNANCATPSGGGGGSGNVNAGAAGQEAYYDWTGTTVAGTSATLKADAFAGSTYDVKLAACNAAVIALGGGTCDARGLTGAQTLASSLTVGDGTHAVKLLLGDMTLTRAAGASILLNHYVTIQGQGPKTIINSANQTTDYSPVIYYPDTGTVGQVQYVELSGFQIGATTRSGNQVDQSLSQLPITSVAAAQTLVVNLTSAAAAVGGQTTYTGTVFAAPVGPSTYINSVVISGFTGANNGSFRCTAWTPTTLTCNNSGGHVESASGTATVPVGIYTGTITGGTSNAFSGYYFSFKGFKYAANEGFYYCVASSPTTLTVVTTGTTLTSETVAADTPRPPYGTTYAVLSGGWGIWAPFEDANLHDLWVYSSLGIYIAPTGCSCYNHINHVQAGTDFGAIYFSSGSNNGTVFDSTAAGGDQEQVGFIKATGFGLWLNGVTGINVYNLTSENTKYPYVAYGGLFNLDSADSENDYAHWAPGSQAAVSLPTIQEGTGTSFLPNSTRVLDLNAYPYNTSSAAQIDAQSNMYGQFGTRNQFWGSINSNVVSTSSPTAVVGQGNGIGSTTQYWVVPVDYNGQLVDTPTSTVGKGLPRYAGAVTNQTLGPYAISITQVDVGGVFHGVIPNCTSGTALNGDVFWVSGLVLNSNKQPRTVTGCTATTLTFSYSTVSETPPAGALMTSDAYNAIAQGANQGVACWDILKDSTNSGVQTKYLALCVPPYVLSWTIYNDDNPADGTAGYTTPTRDSSGDVNIEGALTVAQIQSGKSTNTDLSGTLIMSTGSKTYSFLGTYAYHPICVASDETAIAAVQVTYTSTTSVTFTTTGASDVVDYVCAGRK